MLGHNTAGRGEGCITATVDGMEFASLPKDSLDNTEAPDDKNTKANNWLTFGRRTPDVGYGFTFSIGKLNTDLQANIRLMLIVSTCP